MPTDTFQEFLEQIEHQARDAAQNLLEHAKCEAGDLVVVGCSSSEILGVKIGTSSSPDVANAVLRGLLPVFDAWQINLAAQCCEHLNRALVVERAVAQKFGYPPVNVIPQPKGGGSFATAVYRAFSHPVVVESIQAHAGLDIGGTLIGMHLAQVAVPVRLPIQKIGEAITLAARVRPKFIGGPRAAYDPDLF